MGAWWRRSQSIRTEGEVLFEVALLETEERPVYQRIAEGAAHLRYLGLSNSETARHLGVDDKTVAKAIRWRKRNLQEFQ
jgi:DNA-binding CsgD family transcriptional regulator